MSLRVAARVEKDGSFEYAMGFDEAREGDTRINAEGVELLVAENCRELLEESSLDFVEIEDGTHDFIFFNPNDPSHKQPKS